jgi:hypothetical protein
MIKQITQNILSVITNMLYCDYCGEGLARQEDNKQDIEEFVALHVNCTKPKNKNLNFLNKAEPYV